MQASEGTFNPSVKTHTKSALMIRKHNTKPVLITGGGRSQRALRNDQAVAVVVDVRETDSVGSWSKYADAACAAGFENVGEEEVVPGTVTA